jgi:hypothetical protein
VVPHELGTLPGGLRLPARAFPDLSADADDWPGSSPFCATLGLARTGVTNMPVAIASAVTVRFFMGSSIVVIDVALLRVAF